MELTGIPIKIFIDFSSALLTPVIAIGMFYVAYQQWKTSEKEIRNELFSRRYNNFYSPIRETMSLVILTSIGIGIIDDTKQNIIETHIRKIQESFTNYKHLLPQQIIKIITNHIDNLCKNLSNYAKSNNKDNEKTALLNIIKEYLIILEFVSEYLFIENNKCLNIYQLLSNILIKSIKFITPIKLQEQYLQVKYQKLALKILTKSSNEQKDFISDILRHGTSL